MSNWIGLSVSLLGVLTFACGPGGLGGSGGEEGEGTGEASGDDASDGGSVEGSGSEGGCDAADDGGAPEPSTPLEIHIQNNADVAIFVPQLYGQACGSDPYTLSREGEPIKWYLDQCEERCADVLGGTAQCFCGADCAASPMIRIEPGQFWSTEWAAEVFEDQIIDGECVSEPCLPDVNGEFTCWNPQAAPTGVYTGIANANLTVDACFNDLGEAVECVCGEGEPWCLLQTFGTDIAVEISGMAVYPDDGLLEIIYTPAP